MLKLSKKGIFDPDLGSVKRALHCVRILRKHEALKVVVLFVPQVRWKHTGPEVRNSVRMTSNRMQKGIFLHDWSCRVRILPFHHNFHKTAN